MARHSAYPKINPEALVLEARCRFPRVSIFESTRHGGESSKLVLGNREEILCQGNRMIAAQRWGASCVALTLIVTLTLCGCQGLPSGSTPTAANDAGLTSINHIVFMAQENRSFDSHFGQLPAYWAAHGYPAQPLDGMPANASNPSYSGSSSVSAYAFASECIEDLSPSWNESHLDWNLQSPVSGTAAMNGFVWNAANFALNQNAAGANPQYTDTAGIRAMGLRRGLELLLLHGFELRHFRPMVRAGAGSYASQPHVPVCSDVGRLRLSTGDRRRRRSLTL